MGGVLRLPKGGFKKNPAIGECWDKECSEDLNFNIFISPVLSDTIQILATLLHEMIHATVGLECGHKGEFRRVARATGLAGRLTATYAEEGSELYEALKQLSFTLGSYPGTPMKLKQKPKEKKGWFLVKLVSKNDPTYKFTNGASTYRRKRYAERLYG